MSSRTRLILIMCVGLLLGLGAAGFGLKKIQANSEVLPDTIMLVKPHYDTLVATLNATGQIQPSRESSLNFRVSGQVSAVLVKIGDQVEAGSVLVRIDNRELQLKVAQAQADLEQAQASYQKQAHGLLPADIAAAEAQVTQARGQLLQVEGGVTPADIHAAEAHLHESQTQLNVTQTGPSQTDIGVAESQVQQAQANLQAQRDQLSAAKTNAQSRMEMAANAVRDSQTDYSRIYWFNRRAEKRGVLPQLYIDTETEALRTVENAQSVLDQARVSYAQAQQAEITGIVAGESQIRTAQNALDKLQAGSDAGQIDVAVAQVAISQANLEKLQGEQRRGALLSAQGALAQAQANLERLRGGPLPNDLAIAQAQVHSAQAALDLSKLALDGAVLVAPFAGVVTEVNVSVGETLLPTAEPVVTLADMSQVHIVADVDELDVGYLANSQSVTLTLAALPDVVLAGSVESLSPSAQPHTTITTYQVQITTAVSDTRVRAGMTVNAEIVINQKYHVLVVPRRAVYTANGRRVVDVMKDPSACMPSAGQHLQIGHVQQDVTTGLMNDQLIEITSGLDEHACLYFQGVDARTNPLSSAIGRP